MKTKKAVILLATALGMSGAVQAQTYTDHLEKSKDGKGKVVVVHSKEIDDLVNGKGSAQPKTVAPATPVVRDDKAVVPNPTRPAAAPLATTKTPQDVVKGQSQQPKDQKGDTAKDNAKAREKMNEEEARRAAEARKRVESKSREAEKSSGEDGEMNIPTVDMRKKVMRGSRKVTGYRVQAFAGGNTRQDRQRAQQIGDAIKMKFPDQPVYVHFYSPRWICRVGNFRSYQEARRVLSQVKAMGYGAATIVSGKITVQD